MSNTLQRINNKNKTILLHVISGCGFNLVKGSIAIHATLKNKQLETPPIPVRTNELKINEEIAWNLSTLDLKELKMANTSVRIECIHLPANKSSLSIRLGYILLKVKEAQTVNPTSYDRMENKSYKLKGSKNCNYCLIMSFRIEDTKTIKTPPKQIKHVKLNNNNKNIIDNTDNLERKENNNKSFEKIENVEIDLPKNDVNMLEQTEPSLTKDEPKNIFNFDVQQKLIEELENWKNKQMILFNEKVKIKEEQMLKELNEKWLDDRIRLEEDLSYEISKCKALSDNLDKMADMVKEKESLVIAKEKELAYQKNSIDNNYSDLVQTLQCTHGQTINELTHRVVQLTTDLHYSKQNNIILKKENKELKNDINTNYGFRIHHLENIISNLELKCAEAYQSCMFYKERWITSVRKINQISSKLYGSKTNEH